MVQVQEVPVSGAQGLEAPVSAAQVLEAQVPEGMVQEEEGQAEEEAIPAGLVVQSNPNPLQPTSFSNDPPSSSSLGTSKTGQAQQVRESVEFWKGIAESDFAVRLIENGLVLPFVNKQKVKASCKKHIFPRRCSKKNKVAIREEIKVLLDQEVIEKAPHNVLLYENHVFCITKPNGKLRFILDMKELNTHIRLPKLRMFKFHHCYQSCLVANYACKIDLANAFWHISVHKAYRRFLSFSFDNVNYVWKAMPFGLRIAPYLFCKLLQPLMKHIRKTYNIIIFFYLDDILILAPSRELAMEHCNIVMEVLTKAGLSINVQKSMTVPSDQITFLGVDIDLKNKTFCPSEENQWSCIEKVSAFMSKDRVMLVDFQSLIGSLNFAAPYIKFGKLHLSPLHQFYAAFSADRARRVPFNLNLLLEFWRVKDNYAPIKIPDFKMPKIVISSDASSSGWGARVTWTSGNCSSYSGNWSECMLDEHINIKELRAAVEVIYAIPSAFANSCIRVFSDNKSTVTWLNKGTSTRSEGARELLKVLTNLAYIYNFQVSAFYIKGSSNLLADSLSRSYDYHPELTLKQETFDALCDLLDFIPDVDLFADELNHKCFAYFSASKDSNAVATNALTASWDQFGYPFAFPPSHLINKTIFRFYNSSCKRLLLLVPRCNSSWHRNILRLNHVVIPFKFEPQNFTLNQKECTPSLAHILSEMTAYVL